MAKRRQQQKFSLGHSEKKQNMKLAGHEELEMNLFNWFQQMR
jgi:hypothetical protein